MFDCLEAEVGICGGHAHCLLAHSALERIFCGLVVVCERDDGCTDAEHYGGMDLAMGINLFWIVS